MLLDSGSKSWAGIEQDKHVYEFQPNFPAQTRARTTFWATDAENAVDEEKFEKLWALHHGRGHTYEGWDSQRVRQENVFTYRRARVILSQAEVGGCIRELVARRVVQENLNGFSRYYQGLDGAAIGFASLYEYETEELALDSHLVARSEELLGIDGKKLIKYVWDNYDVPGS